jgi:uncharacterized protein YwgA
MFLLAKEGGIPEDEKYSFRPYLYGPMSAELYRDLDALTERGLVDRIPVEGRTWTRARATDSGRRYAEELLETNGSEVPKAINYLYELKQSMSERGFGDLLEDVYGRYPEYAGRSVFRK